MKLVTFDAGRVGRLEGEGDDGVVVELECASTREWFHDGGPLFPHPVELHQHNDVIAGLRGRLAALREGSQS